jgi:hypothetical protein
MPRPGSIQKGRTIHLRQPAVEFLELRGAQGDRRGGEHSRSAMLARHLEFYAAVINFSDPRDTRNFSAAYFDLTMQLLSNPWDIRARDIVYLHQYLADLPTFDDLVRRARVKPHEYLAKIQEFSYAEKLMLVDQAEQRHRHHVDVTFEDARF